MKKLLGEWSAFEILFLLTSILVITICFFFNQDKNIFSLLVSIFGVITVLCGSKGLILASYITLFYIIVYLILSYTLGYYGEIIINIALMLPLNIATIVSWNKNKSKEDESRVEINKIHGIEYIYLTIATFGLAVAFYFILAALNTNELIISTLSLVGSLVASYLYYRRSSNYALGYLFNDIVLICLWGVSLKNNLENLPVIITFVIYFLNDLYGLYNWKKTEKEQNNK